MNTLNATVTARAVGPCSEIMDAKQRIHDLCELSTSFRSIVEYEGGRVSPETDVRVHQDVGSATYCKIGYGGSGHVLRAAETIHEEEDI